MKKLTDDQKNTIKPGTVTILTGDSGVGKSTEALGVLKFLDDEFGVDLVEYYDYDNNTGDDRIKEVLDDDHKLNIVRNTLMTFTDVVAEIGQIQSKSDKDVKRVVIVDSLNVLSASDDLLLYRAFPEYWSSDDILICIRHSATEADIHKISSFKDLNVIKL